MPATLAEIEQIYRTPRRSSLGSWAVSVLSVSSIAAAAPAIATDRPNEEAISQISITIPAGVKAAGNSAGTRESGTLRTKSGYLESSIADFRFHVKAKSGWIEVGRVSVPSSEKFYPVLEGPHFHYAPGETVIALLEPRSDL